MYFTAFSILLINFVCKHVECIQNGDFISITEAPYYASLIDEYGNKSSCGASIISEYWLVSAAHCVMDGYDDLLVRVGSTTNYSNGTTHIIDNVIIHENFTFYLFNVTRVVSAINDISLIKLKEPIKFNEYQQPIRLRSISPKENETVIIVGLGRERVAKTPPSLKKTAQSVAATGPPLVPDRPSVFHLRNSTSHACPGDSGSPGIIDNELAGILVSGDERCVDWVQSHTNRYPGALTRVDMFYNWILNQTGIDYS